MCKNRRLTQAGHLVSFTLFVDIIFTKIERLFSRWEGHELVCHRLHALAQVVSFGDQGSFP